MQKDCVIKSELNLWKKADGKLHIPSQCIEITKKFERAIADSQEAKWAVSVNSCTSGLMAALFAIGIERGDEIIIPPLSWPQTYFPASLLGANLKMVDLSPFWPVMNPEEVKKVISSKTKAVISVGLWGFPTGLREINEICQEKGVFHILDAAQLFNSKSCSRGIGDLADFVVLSFGSTKGIYGLGEGGMVLGNSRILRDRIMFITQHPYRIHSEVNDVDFLNENFGLNFNFRLNPITAIYGLNKFFKNELQNNHRKNNIYSILNSLKKFQIKVLTPPEGWHSAKSNRTSILINTKDLSKILKPNLISDLDEKGVLHRRCCYCIASDIPRINFGNPFPWYKNYNNNVEESTLKQTLPWTRYWKQNLLIISVFN